MAETAEKRERSRLEDITLDGSGLTDADAVRCAIIAAKIASGTVLDIPMSVASFFGEVAAQLDALVSWRQLEIDRIERCLSEVESDDPALWDATG